MRWDFTVATLPPITWPTEEKAKYGPDPSCRLSAQHVSMCFITPKKVSRLCKDVCVLCVCVGQFIVYFSARTVCVRGCACAQIPPRAHMCVCRDSAETQRGYVLEPVFPAAPCPWWGGINICFPSSLSLAAANRAARQNVPLPWPCFPHTHTHTHTCCG